MEVAAASVPKIPQRLAVFFQRYPPHLYSAKHTGASVALLSRREIKEARIAEAEAKAAQKRNAASIKRAAAGAQAIPSASPPSIVAGSEEATNGPIPTTDANGRIVDGQTRATRFPPNPFLPFRNPTTGRWAGARISLRTQADLVKLAKKTGVEALLPPGRKATAFKEAQILQRGLRVKGTGEGQKVKGHKWERTMEATLQKRKEALEKMPALIREWKQLGHGRGWKKYPKVKGPR